MFKSQQAASSILTYRWTYDVFLSFRGEDTRLGFTGHLFKSLHDRGIKAFIDDEGLIRGEEITPALSKAIEQSRIAIVVFSKNYASSTFCLNELLQILQCLKEKGRLVWPVFYDVNPSDVRHQKGSYGKALTHYLNSFTDNQKVQNWRNALSEVANLSGWHIQRGKEYEYELIGRITDEVSKKINRTPLYVTKYPVGLVPRVQKVTSLLDLCSIGEVKMVGICGTGGIGKSTIARAIYNLIADNFEGLCFLSNVREISDKHGLSHLQKSLLYDIVKEKNLKLGNVHKGIPIIEHRLNQKKVLLILDDVDKLKQLRVLAGKCEWFGSGSRIIITTRDKHLLTSHGVETIYDVEELNPKESLQLFHWNALKKDNINSRHMSISNRAIQYCSGLPLALEVIGSNLYDRSIDEWASALAKYERTPAKQVLEVLKISYDGLEEDEKEIFLDLACFFTSNPLEYVIDMLRSARGIQSEYAIRVLIDRCLIKIDCKKLIIMHDLIRDMGTEIVRQESPKDPGSRCRLWHYEDILHVLQGNTGTKKIEAIVVDLPRYKEVRWSGKSFKKMRNLRLLIIRNASFSRGPKYLPNNLRALKWSGYPWKSLPSGFHPAQLVHFDLYDSCCVSLKPLSKKFENLTCMNFSKSKFLKKVPDLSGASNLTKLHFDDCQHLTKIHDSVGLLDKIREFSAKQCHKLRTIPHCIKWTSLEHLHLFGCSSLRNFPEIFGMVENMTKLDLSWTAIEELPSSICNLIGLTALLLKNSKCLKQLPLSICMLPKLRILAAELCNELRYFKKYQGEKRESPVMSLCTTTVIFSKCNLSDDTLPLCLSGFPYVSHLDLSFNNFSILPACLKECHFLKRLCLDNCKQLRHIAGIPSTLEVCEARNCTSLTSLSSSILLDQVLQRPRKKSLVLPGQRIPEWFDFYSEGESVFFWIREEFPAIVACVVVGSLADQDCLFTLNLSMYVNDFIQDSFEQESTMSTIAGNHVFLCDLQSRFPVVIFPKVGEWNLVQVRCKKDTWMKVSGATIKSIGVHVSNKQENSMENICFTNPNYLKRTSHFSRNSNMNGVSKLQRTSLNNVICVVSRHKEKDVMACNEGKESWEYQNWDSNSKKPTWATENSIIDQGYATASKYKGKELKVFDVDSSFMSTCPMDVTTSDQGKGQLECQFTSSSSFLDWDSSSMSTCPMDETTSDQGKGQLECEFPSSSVTTNIQAPSPTAPNNEVASEDELQNKLACLEERKKEIEEQINSIEAQLSVCQSSKVMATKRKREIFEEGKDTESSKRRVEGTSAMLEM